MGKSENFFVKNCLHVLTFYFLCWAVWACINWPSLELVQKLVMGIFAILVLHEYEESYKNRFYKLMGSFFGIDGSNPSPDVHIPALLLIAGMHTLALLFPGQLWLSFGVFVLALFEMFVHSQGIIIFRLKGVSPGWWTAMLMGILAILGIVLVNRSIDYPGIQWLWGILFFLASFALMEIFTHKALGIDMKTAVPHAKAFLKERFGKNQ